METLFIIGSMLLFIAIITSLGTILYAGITMGKLSSAKSEDFLEKYYEEEFGDDLK